MSAPRLLAVPAVLLLLLAGCGSKKSDSSSSTTSTTATPKTTATTPAGPKPAGSAVTLTISKDLSKKPAIPKPSGPPPSTLAVKDVVVGKGRAAKAGDTIAVQYVGATYKNAKEFDASWDRGQLFPFQLGAGMVIPGWDKGIVGMRVGGRRLLVIPANLAYGQNPPPGSGIAPGDTLVFVVDLKAIR